MNDKIKVLEPAGTLNAIKGNEVRREVEYILTNGAEVVLIDMKDVQFIDSSGLGALVAAMQFVRKNNKKLFVCSVNNQVKMLFELTKIDRIIQVIKDREEFDNQFNNQVLIT